MAAAVASCATFEASKVPWVRQLAHRRVAVKNPFSLTFHEAVADLAMVHEGGGAVPFTHKRSLIRTGGIMRELPSWMGGGDEERLGSPSEWCMDRLEVLAKRGPVGGPQDQAQTVRWAGRLLEGDPSTLVRAAAADLLAKLGVVLNAPAEPGDGPPDATALAAASELLNLVRGPESSRVPELAERLATQSPRLAPSLLGVSLEALGDQQGNESQNESLRTLAALAVGPALEAGMRDPHPLVQARALGGLLLLVEDPELALSLAEQAAGSPEPILRMRTARLLGTGQHVDGDDVLRLLILLSADVEAEVATAAMGALADLTGASTSLRPSVWRDWWAARPAASE